MRGGKGRRGEEKGEAFHNLYKQTVDTHTHAQTDRHTRHISCYLPVGLCNVVISRSLVEVHCHRVLPRVDLQGKW